MQLGPCRVHVIQGGSLRLDGGAMFGPVPRVVWEKKVTPDDRHRIPMQTNCLFIETNSRRILVDTGYGSKADARQRDIQGLEEGNPIVAHLAGIGVEPASITHVILTHLHFDHAGGCTHRTADGHLEPVFPQAEHWVQRVEWEDATGNRPELLGSYFEEDFVPLAERSLLRFIDGNEEIAPSVRVRLLGGHTRGMQMVEVGEPGSMGFFPADLFPTPWHLKTFWQVAYDQFPLEVRRAKPALLAEVAAQGGCLFFCHDIARPWGYLRADTRGEWEIDPERLPDE